MAKSKTISVMFPGPGPRTVHRELGLLTAGKPFKMDAAAAQLHINNGLLVIVASPGKKRRNDNGD